MSLATRVKVLERQMAALVAALTPPQPAVVLEIDDDRARLLAERMTNIVSVTASGQSSALGASAQVAD